LVPSYLLLGEASIGLSRFQQAEEYLSLAKYAVLKKPDCSHSLRSQLHRNFGRLYASQGKFEEAVYQLANDVYYSSLQFGPENISTTGGYFQLGTVFAAKNQQSSALAMFEKVVEIWYAALTSATKTMEQTNVEIIGNVTLLL
jgi:tetratricopeptide (TPR) repeat protein